MMQGYDALLSCQRVLNSADPRYASIVAGVQEEMKKVATQLSDMAGTILAEGGPPPAFAHCADFRIVEVRAPLERWCEEEVGASPSAAAPSASAPGLKGRPDVEAGGETETDALAKAQEAARAAVAASLAGTAWAAHPGSEGIAGDHQ